MSYCQSADVQAVVAQYDLSGSTAPLTAAQVTAVITDTGYEIDLTLEGAGYATPITAPTNFVGYLLTLNVYGAAAALLKSLFPDSVGPGQTPAYAFWEQRYQAGIADLKTGAKIPGGLAVNSRHTAPSSYFTVNPDEEATLGDNAVPVFTTRDIY